LNDRNIYIEPATGLLCSLINLAFDPMDSLVLMNFEGDPDYEGLELQLFNDKSKGKGAAAIMWRTDKKGDFYVTPGVILDRDKIKVSGGVGELIVQKFKYRLDINQYGIDAWVSLTLKDGRPVEFRLNEKRQRPRKPLNILAPVGGVTNKPLCFPMFYLQNIDLVQRADSWFSFQIGENHRVPPKIPIPMPYSGKLVYFLRYCPDPIIGLFNMRYEGKLPILEPNENTSLLYKNMHYDLINNGGHYEIQKVSATEGKHKMRVTFNPSLPNIIDLKDGVRVNGRFNIGVDKTDNIVQGVYQIRYEDNRIYMEIYPDKNWKPRGNILTQLTFLFFPPTFRSWVKTYHWYAVIEINREAREINMQSSWRRN
jgi:hypothetical protein